MLSPKDIETKEFSRSKMGGYKPEEVDDFLDQILSDYVVLLEEKELLNKKITTLTEKIEVYRDEQDKQKYSAVNNQRNYDDVIANAKKKADKLVYEAQDYAKKLIEAAKVEAEREQQVKSQLTAEVEDFKSKLLSIYENHVKLISSIPVIKRDEEYQTSATLEMLKVATADVQEMKNEASDIDEMESEADDLISEIEDRSSTIIMPSISAKINENKADIEKDEVRKFSRVRHIENTKSELFDEDDDDYLEDEYKKASKRLVNTKDLEEEDEEKSEKVRGLFDSKPKRGLFGNKKTKPVKKKKYEDDDDDDDLDFDDDDDFYDDDDE